jgi:UTP-glucose-1-phosphate uridylyltransferase
LTAAAADAARAGSWIASFLAKCANIWMHLLAPSIYDILGEMIRDDLRDNGEFQLTRAQEIQRQREGYLALEMTAAQRFDFGVPDDFVANITAFRNGARSR